MAERFKAQAWKACVLSKVPWVRIPLSPPFFIIIKLCGQSKFDIIRFDSKKYKKIEKKGENLWK